MNFFLDDPMNSFVENLLMKSTEKAKRKKPAPGKYNPYDDSPLLAPTSHDGKDPDTPQYGKHWSSYAPRARMAETKMKRRKELQLVLDTIEQLYAVTEKAKKKGEKKGIQTPPALPLEDNSSKPLRGKHWSQWKSPRLAENQMKRRKELQLVLDTIEEKAKKEPKPTKTPKPPKPPRFRGESAAERIKRVKEELAKLRGSSNKQLSGGERDVAWLAWGGNAGRSWAASKVAVAQKAKKTIVIGPGESKPIPVYGPNHKRLTRYEDGSYGPWQRPPNNKPKDKGEPGDKGKLLSSKRTLPDGTIKWDKATRKRR